MATPIPAHDLTLEWRYESPAPVILACVPDFDCRSRSWPGVKKFRCAGDGSRSDDRAINSIDDQSKVFLTGVIAEGTDHYQVLYALAEVDPSIHAGDLIVADAVDGHKLGRDGLFKLVSTEEKRPARWVRNLTAITVMEAKP